MLLVVSDQYAVDKPQLSVASTLRTSRNPARARLILFAAAIAKVKFLTRAEEPTFAKAMVDAQVVFQRAKNSKVQ